MFYFSSRVSTTDVVIMQIVTMARGLRASVTSTLPLLEFYLKFELSNDRILFFFFGGICLILKSESFMTIQEILLLVACIFVRIPVWGRGL